MAWTVSHCILVSLKGQTEINTCLTLVRAPIREDGPLYAIQGYSTTWRSDALISGTVGRRGSAIVCGHVASCRVCKDIEQVADYELESDPFALETTCIKMCENVPRISSSTGKSTIAPSTICSSFRQSESALPNHHFPCEGMGRSLTASIGTGRHVLDSSDRAVTCGRLSVL